jgi:hypothetical protein
MSMKSSIIFDVKIAGINFIPDERLSKLVAW